MIDNHGSTWSICAAYMINCSREYDMVSHPIVYYGNVFFPCAWEFCVKDSYLGKVCRLS